MRPPRVWLDARETLARRYERAYCINHKVTVVVMDVMSPSPRN